MSQIGCDDDQSTVVHFVETSPSALREMPWISLKEYKVTIPASLHSLSTSPTPPPMSLLPSSFFLPSFSYSLLSTLLLTLPPSSPSYLTTPNCM